MRRLYLILGTVAVCLGAFFLFVWLTGEATKPTGNAASGMPLNRDIFTESATVNNGLKVTRNAGPGPDGQAGATLLDDDTDEYGSIFQDFPVADDGKTHLLRLFLKPGTTARTQIILHYFGGPVPKSYYAYVDFPAGVINGLEGKATLTHVGDDWYRLELVGAQTRGNTHIRFQIYPRHGQGQDKGTLWIAKGWAE